MSRRLEPSHLSWASVAFLILLVGCDESRPEATPRVRGISEELSREADAIMHLLGFGEVLFALLLLAAGWAAIRLIQSGVVLTWHMGMDPLRRLAPIRSAANILILGAVGFLLLRRFLLAAPVMTLLALTVVSGASVIVLAPPIQNVWAGFVMSFRRRLRAGDRVTLGGQVGIVRDVSLTQLHLRSPDGASIFIPNRMVLNEAVRVEQAKNTETVSVQVKPPVAPTPDTVQAARRAALFSPFRVPGTSMEVRVGEAGEVQVTIQVWSGQAVREAKINLEARLQSLLLPQETANQQPR